MNIYDDLLFKSFIQDRNLKPSTKEKYYYQLKNYCEYLNKTPTQLIDEAEQEEDQQIRMRSRSIKQYLTDFKQHMEKENYSNHSITVTLTSIRTYYNHYDIMLPKVRIKQETKTESIEDIPSKEDIIKALRFANVKYQAIILLISSSGMGSGEVRNLTYHDFLKSISEYVEIAPNTMVHVGEIVSQLQKNHDKHSILVPCFRIRRVKTGTPIITFCTPESLTAILEYLKQYPPSSLEDPLFRTLEGKKLRTPVISRYFQTLNQKCEFGNPDRQVKFRSHAVGRKYFASTLSNKVGLRQITIDFFLGHSIGKTSTAYFKPDPESLKQEYMDCIKELSMQDVEVHVMETEDRKELKNLRKEVDMLKAQRRLDPPQ